MQQPAFRLLTLIANGWTTKRCLGAGEMSWLSSFNNPSLQNRAYKSHKSTPSIEMEDIDHKELGLGNQNDLLGCFLLFACGHEAVNPSSTGPATSSTRQEPYLPAGLRASTRDTTTHWFGLQQSGIGAGSRGRAIEKLDRDSKWAPLGQYCYLWASRPAWDG